MAHIQAISELKKQLRKAVEALVDKEEEDGDDDDGNDSCDLGVADYAIRALCALKDLKLKQTDKEYVKLGNLGFQEPPPEFRCPISGILMRDPVVVASGQTYEEQCIRKWLEDGNRLCPQTDQVLPHTLLIRNLSVKKMIVNWCKLHQVDVPRTSLPNDEEECPAKIINKEHLLEMLERLSSSSISDQIEVAKELQLCTSRLPSFRALFGEITGAIPKLFSPLLLERIHSNNDLHENFVATILNISTEENNRNKIVSECPLAVYFLVESLRNKGIEIQSHAAAALYVLSTVDSNKPVIGESGAVHSLIKVMEEGNLLALKDSALAILNLCTVIVNRERAISEGAVIAVAGKLKGRILIDEMLDILAMLSRHHQAIEEMDEQGMLRCLFDILKESATSEQNKEHCVAIIHAMCFSDRTILRKIDLVENGYETLSQVARTGTSRAKRKATSILERLSTFVFFSHTA